MKALLSNTTRTTCCLWPIGAKIQTDPSFSCKHSLALVNIVYLLDKWLLFDGSKFNK